MKFVLLKFSAGLPKEIEKTHNKLNINEDECKNTILIYNKLIPIFQKQKQEVDELTADLYTEIPKNDIPQFMKDMVEQVYSIMSKLNTMEQFVKTESEYWTKRSKEF